MYDAAPPPRARPHAVAGSIRHAGRRVSTSCNPARGQPRASPLRAAVSAACGAQVTDPEPRSWPCAHLSARSRRPRGAAPAARDRQAARGRRHSPPRDSERLADGNRRRSQGGNASGGAARVSPHRVAGCVARRALPLRFGRSFLGLAAVPPRRRPGRGCNRDRGRGFPGLRQRSRPGTGAPRRSVRGSRRVGGAARSVESPGRWSGQLGGAAGPRSRGPDRRGTIEGYGSARSSSNSATCGSVAPRPRA